MGNPRIVFLSELFAADPESPIGQAHKDKEDVIRASGLPFSIVRAGNFMTNAIQWLETIQRDGVVYNGMGASAFGVRGMAVRVKLTGGPVVAASGAATTANS